MLLQCLWQQGQFADLYYKYICVVCLQRLRGEMADLERQLRELQKKLEEETTLRVDYQNRCQSLKEELEFKDKIHNEVSILLF